MAETNRQWILRKRPQGDITDDCLELVETPIPDLGDGQILVRNVYLSVDPTNRIWMSDMDQYMPPVEVGDVMRGGTQGVVVRSNNPDFKQGDYVAGGLSWEEYSVLGGASKLPTELGVPKTAFASVLGMTGLTAYFGLLDITHPEEGETLVVSAAAGAVGSIAGQIGKIKGCYVVGIAGGPEKCKMVTDEFGFDACIDYKNSDINKELKEACPKGIDIDFENVGGEIMDAVLTNINLGARISLCGLISTYNADGDWWAPKMFRNILMKRATVEGFIISDYFDQFPEGVEALAGWLLEGKLKYKVDIVKGIENTPAALDRIFTGKNIGKQLVQISEEP